MWRLQNFLFKELANIHTGLGRILLFFSITATALGLAAIILVTSIINGLEKEIVCGIVGVQGHFKIHGTINDKKHRDMASIIKPYDYITDVFPVIERQAMVIHNGSARGLISYGLTPQHLRQKDIINKNIIWDDGHVGSTDPNNTTHDHWGNFQGRQIVVGQSLARSLSLKLGDELQLLAPQAQYSVFGATPRFAQFKVTGIFKTGLGEYDSYVVFLPMAIAQKFFMTTDRYSYLEGIMKDPYNFAHLRSLSTISQKYSPISWLDSKSSLLNSFKIEKNAMTIVLLIVILIAIFNVVVLLYITIQNKRFSIAILRAMGISNNKIIFTLMTIGMMVIAIGIALGSTLGIYILNNAQNIINFVETNFAITLFNPQTYGVSQFPVHFNATEIMHIIILTVVLCLLAVLAPAYRATRTNPAQVLRNE